MGRTAPHYLKSSVVAVNPPLHSILMNFWAKSNKEIVAELRISQNGRCAILPENRYNRLQRIIIPDSFTSQLSLMNPMFEKLLFPERIKK